MEGIGWKPLDLIVGGMLTAGVAFGVYKLGVNKRGAGAGDLDASSLQDCIALARRPSELEMSVLPQPDAQTRRLAESLAQSIQAASCSASDGDINRYSDSEVARNLNRAADLVTFRRSINRHQLHSKDADKDFRKIFEKEETPPDQSPPKRRRSFHPESFSSPLMAYRTPPELTRQLQAYRDTLTKWTADSEAKIEKMEQQRMELATELHVTREALQAERRLRAEAEQRRHRVESQLKEIEVRLQKYSEAQSEASRREEVVQNLEEHVRDMEEQLEGLYMHNVVTPRQAVQENVAKHEELTVSLRQAEDELRRQQQDMQEMENDIVNLSEQLNKARKDSRQLGEDNTGLQKQLQGAQRAARDVLATLYERSADKDESGSDHLELTELLNAPDAELPLDKLLQCVTALLLDS